MEVEKFSTSILLIKQFKDWMSKDENVFQLMKLKVKAWPQIQEYKGCVGALRFCGAMT